MGRDPLFVSWDHVATALVATPMVAAALAAAWWARRRTAWGRRHSILVGASCVAASALAVAWAAYDNIGIRETEYASLSDAYELAPPERKAAMLRIAREAGRRREIYSMSYSQRNRFLHAGGYCRVSFEPACSPVPRGTGHWMDGREGLATMPGEPDDER